MSRCVKLSLAFVLSLAHSLFAEPATLPTLRSGQAQLEWWHVESTIAPRLLRGDVAAEAQSAVCLVIADAATGELMTVWEEYRQVAQVDGSLVATAHIKTPTGTVFDVVDRWSVDPAVADAFQIDRTITVGEVSTADGAYASGVEFIVPNVTQLSDADVFVPGIWYASAAHTPGSGLIQDLGQQDFMLREDRMPLPLVSVRDRAGGMTLTLEHLEPDGATIASDDSLKRVVDERLRFGSLGIRRDENGVRVAFRFPGSEGQQTSIFGYKSDLRTVERFHPIKKGATQHYTLRVSLGSCSSFSTQMRDCWRRAFNAAKPEVVAFDAKGIYDASIGVLDHYWYERGEVSGFPFGVALPDGTVKDPSLQMGFVGQQLPCATYLIDEGLRAKRPELVEKGEKVVDFWVKNSFNEKGVPRTWYDLEPTPHWRNYNSFLRVVTDGTSGILRAWQIERAAARDKPAWFAFSRRVGDWLLKIQNKDGSFYREWKFDGTTASQSKTSTLHPVRLLVDLSCATGERKYREAAIRAAEFALKENQSGATYVGGTPDNPDVIDKEAGWIAMDSYLALYDVTQETKWLDAAVDAGTFTETWVYGWNVPLPIDKESVGVPRVKTFAGTNLIATGHSGVDNFLAFASFSYTRLWIYTGEEHFRDVARLLQHNSAQFIDTGEKNGNSPGYAQPGLQVEAFTLAVNRGHSVRIWLPWLTSATLEPMARLRETFGVIDVDGVNRLDAATRSRLNLGFARNRGFTRRASTP